MKYYQLRRLGAAFLSCAMLAAQYSTAVAANDSSLVDTQTLSIVADGPSIEVREETSGVNLFTKSSYETTIDPDYGQEVKIAIKNTSSTPVEYYLSVENSYDDLSMNFVKEGYCSIDSATGDVVTNTATLDAYESAEAILMVFAQEAESSQYPNIKLVSHIVEGASQGATESYLTLKVENLGLDIESSVAEDTDKKGVFHVTITNKGPAVNSLKVEAEDTIASYVFFPEPITNYPLQESESITFDVHSTGVTSDLSGNLLVKGNGSQETIPLALTPTDLGGISGNDLVAKQRPAQNFEIDGDTIDPVANEDGTNGGTIPYTMTYEDNGESKELPVSIKMTISEISADQADVEEDGFTATTSNFDSVNKKVTLKFSRLLSQEEYEALVGSSALEDTAGADDSTETAESEDTAEADDSTEAAESEDTAGADDSTETAESEDTAEADDSTEVAEPEDTAEADESTEAAEPVDAAEADESTEVAEPEDAVEADDSTESEEAEKPAAYNDSTYDSVLAEFEIEMDVSDLSPEDIDELALAYDEKRDGTGALDYVANLPDLPDRIRDDYLAHKQLVILINYIDSLDEDNPVRVKFEEAIAKFYNPPVDNPFELLRDTERQLVENTEERIKNVYPEFQKILIKDEFKPIVETDTDKKIEEEIKDDEEEKNRSYVVVTEDGYQCTNRGEISSQYVVPEYTYELDNYKSSENIRVFYSGRITSEDSYVNFEPITYKLTNNGKDAGTSTNQGLSELNIIEIPADTVEFGNNTFVRDYDVNPGTHFINTDNTFYIVYPMDAKVQLADTSLLHLATPDFDIYKKNIFVTDADGNYVDHPIAGENNTLHVSISNRGAAAGFFKLSITDEKGTDLLGDRNKVELAEGSERDKYYYLPAFFTQTLKIEGVNLTAATNKITVTITDVSSLVKENESDKDNNTATMELTARDRQTPQQESLSPETAKLGETVQLKAVVQSGTETDIESVDFYMDDTLLGTAKGSGKTVYTYTTTIPDDETAVGTHPVKAVVHYTAGTSSAPEPKTDDWTWDLDVTNPHATVAWATVTLPEDVDTSAAGTVMKLLTYDTTTEKYAEVSDEFELQSEDGTTSLLLPGDATATERTFVIIQTDPTTGKSKIYSGTFNATGSTIDLNSQKTLSGADFGEGLTVTIPGLSGSYEIAPEADGSIKLPEMRLYISGNVSLSEGQTEVLQANVFDLTKTEEVITFNAAEVSTVEGDVPVEATAMLKVNWPGDATDTAEVTLTSRDVLGEETLTGTLTNGTALGFMSGSYNVGLVINGLTYELYDVTLTDNSTTERTIDNEFTGNLQISNTKTFYSPAEEITAALEDLKDQNGNVLTKGPVDGYMVYIPEGDENNISFPVSITDVGAAFTTKVPATTGQYATKFVTSLDLLETSDEPEPGPEPEPTYYTITASAGSGGSITPSGSVSVEEGTDQEFVISADSRYNSRYNISGITVDGNALSTFSSSSQTYTFDNVQEDHSISATFIRVSGSSGSSSSSGASSGGSSTTKPKTEEKTGTTEETQKLPFTDVSESDWFYDDVVYVYENNLFNGTSDSLFSPNSSMTRAMFVTVLSRLENKLHGTEITGDSSFDDVKTDMWYTDAIGWAVSKEITNGISSNLFGVNNPVTREQACTLFIRYLQAINYDLSASEASAEFNDGDTISEWAKEAVSKSQQLGLVQGRTDGSFSPKDSMTRAECSAVFHRLMDLLNAETSESSNAAEETTTAE